MTKLEILKGVWFLLCLFAVRCVQLPLLFIACAPVAIITLGRDFLTVLLDPLLGCWRLVNPNYTLRVSLKRYVVHSTWDAWNSYFVGAVRRGTV